MDAESLLVGATLDHVELYVPDRSAAAAWYARVLGLQALASHAAWATEQGPLMISADGGQTMIALFTGAPVRPHARRSHPRVAFRVDGTSFLRFVGCALEGPVHDASGAPLDALTPIDHRGAFSVYFSDPWGHQLEVTTYDWRHVAERGDPGWLGASRELLTP